MSTLNFRKQVRIELIKRGMTMSDLARQMGISGDYLRKIVRGKRKATERRQEIKTILKLKENSNEEQKNGTSPSPQGRQNKNLGGSHLDEAAA